MTNFRFDLIELITEFGRLLFSLEINGLFKLIGFIWLTVATKRSIFHLDLLTLLELPLLPLVFIIPPFSCHRHHY